MIYCYTVTGQTSVALKNSFTCDRRFCRFVDYGSCDRHATGSKQVHLLCNHCKGFNTTVPHNALRGPGVLITDYSQCILVIMSIVPAIARFGSNKLLL